METKRLYRENVYLKKTTAKIVSAEYSGNAVLLKLDQTVFFPTGGGQSCDKGFISGREVLDVYEEGEDIIHKVSCAPGLSWQIGQEAELEIDWEHRFDNMQRHCGEHILTGMFHHLFRGTNKGFHMGEDYMTIDISLEDSPTHQVLTWQMAKEAELLANEAIWHNVPVTTLFFKTKKDAEGIPVRKPITLEKNITIVCVGSPENPSDCVACCGTHPSSSGQVGLIKVFKVESNKGMFRVYFEAGKRAFLKYERQYDILQALSNSISAGEDDLLEKYTIQQEKNKEVRNQLHFLKKNVIQKEGENIISKVSAGEMPGCSSYSVLSLDDLASLGREIAPHVGKIYFLIHRPTNTVFLVSNGKTDCGKLVKENASIYGGKGGGNSSLARAIFSKSEYVDTFIDLIEKHLR